MVHWPLPPDRACSSSAVTTSCASTTATAAARRTSRSAPPTRTRLLTRRFGPDQYTLEDMALDTVGLLDALELDSAHLVGVSMGGMIAQTVAATRPRRVRSLTSIMSTTGSRRVGQPRAARLPAAAEAGPARARRLRRAHARVPDRDRRARRRARHARGPRVHRRHVRPRPRRARHRPPARGDPRLRRPHEAAARDRRADARDPRRQGPAHLAVGRQSDREGDPRRAADARPRAWATGCPERLWPLLVDAIAEHVAGAERARRARTAV